MIPTYTELKDELKSLDSAVYEDFRIRIHRALSWIKAVEEEGLSKDFEIISYWISFNACYSAIDHRKEFDAAHRSKIFEKLIELDEGREIYDMIWDKHQSTIRVLLNNQYIYGPFWENQKGADKDWEASYDRSNTAGFTALVAKDTVTVLSVVFGRIYVLRNQLMHGSATYGSEKNRSQIDNSHKLLKDLVPLFIKVMLDHPFEDWGEISYPPVGK